MKLYNYLSMFLVAGAATLTSCSQDEETNGMDALQNFQISVVDKGYQDADGTRAVEKDYTTNFVDGDAIGIFATKNNMLVADITNRKFTMKEGEWTLDDAGDDIEYKGSEFNKMKFYAYYPYDASVTFEPAKADPFETYVNNWTVATDQSGDAYTQSDLMTSDGRVDGDRLKGKIAFAMEHRMALAVIKMPKIVYDFTNANIDNYNLPVTVGSFTLNNVAATPYYQASTDTYRFLVNPSKNFSIKGDYSGVREKEYTASGSLARGTAKLYNINDPDKIDYTLAIGDYFCADGRLVSKDTETVPANVIGIVNYVGNTQPSVMLPNTYTEKQDALRRDYPNCKHGMVIALNDVGVDKFATERNAFFGNWFANDDEWVDKFVANDNKVTPIALPGILGYNNTRLMELSPNNATACDVALVKVNAYRTDVPVPNVACPWFVPSLREWEITVEVLTAVNEKITAAGGTELVSGGVITSKNCYWSSNERTGNAEIVYQHNLTAGTALTPRRNQGSQAAYFRMMLAF